MSEEETIQTVTVEVSKPKRGRPKKQVVASAAEPAVEEQPELTPEPDVAIEGESEPVITPQTTDEVELQEEEIVEVLPSKTPRGRTTTRQKAVSRTPRQRKATVSAEEIKESHTEQVAPLTLDMLHQQIRQSKTEKYKRLLAGNL